MAQHQFPVVTKVANLGPGPSTAKPVRLGLELADGGRATFVLTLDATIELFHYLSPLVSAAPQSRTRLLHDAREGHASFAVDDRIGLLEFETTGEADLTVAIPHEALVRFADRLAQTLEKKS